MFDRPAVQERRAFRVDDPVMRRRLSAADRTNRRAKSGYTAIDWRRGTLFRTPGKKD